MNDITKWLAEHGFERFADVFRENEIDLEALSELTDEHLKEMGLPLGPRVKMIKAIERLALEALLFEGQALESLDVDTSVLAHVDEPDPHSAGDRGRGDREAGVGGDHDLVATGV